MRRFAVLIGIFYLLLVVAVPCMAGSWQTLSGNEVIAQDAVIENDLFFNGDRLEVNGEIKGDLIVWAGQVVINGRVNGNILGVIWDKLIINGEVQDHIRGFATNFEMNGRVDGSITVVAVMFNSSPKSMIGKGILGAFSKLSLKGEVEGPVDINSAPTTKIGGKINGNLKCQGAPITWQSPVEITGAVHDYSGFSNDPAKIKGVQIGKGYHLHQPETAYSAYSKVITLISIVWFIGSLLASLVLFRIFPRTFWVITEPGPINFRRNMLIGLLSFFGLPLLIIILSFTIVGIPLAILLGLIYLLLVLFSGIPLNLWFGRLLFKSRLHPSLMIIIGGLLIMLINFIPVVNLIVPLIFLWLGFGMVLGNIKPQIMDRKKIDFRV